MSVEIMQVEKPLGFPVSYQIPSRTEEEPKRPIHLGHPDGEQRGFVHAPHLTKTFKN